MDFRLGRRPRDPPAPQLSDEQAVADGRTPEGRRPNPGMTKIDLYPSQQRHGHARLRIIVPCLFTIDYLFLHV